MFIATSGTMGYGNGHPIVNKILTPDLFDLIVTKTLTNKPRKGNLGINPFKVIKPINKYGEIDYINDIGVVNAVGLTNKGINWWINKCYPTIEHKEKIIVSITPDVSISKLEDLDIHGIEINLSCPNDIFLCNLSATNIMSILEKIKTNHKIYLKINEFWDFYYDYNIEAISFNSIPWNLFFPHIKSPLYNYNNGSVSGKIMRNKHNIKLNIPVIRGIWDKEDVTNDLNGIGSVSFLHSLKVRKIIKEYKNKYD